MTNILIASALAFAKRNAVQSFTKSINCRAVQTFRFSKIQQSVKRTTTALRAADESPVNQTVSRNEGRPHETRKTDFNNEDLMKLTELAGEGDSFSLPQKKNLSDVLPFPPDSSSSSSNNRRAVESEIERMELKVAAVIYCMSNFGNIVTPETREKEFVLMYRDFNKEDLNKHLMNLQAEKLQLLNEKIEILKQKTISMITSAMTFLSQ